MKNTWKSLLLMLAIGLVAMLGMSSAQAVVTCGALTRTTLNFAYISGTNSTSTNNVMSNAVTVICTRTNASDKTMFLNANNGTHPVGVGVNGAILGANTANVINYNLYRAAGCSLTFGTTVATQISASFVLGANIPETLTFNYWGCISGQSIASYPPGIYTDDVTLTLSGSGLSPNIVDPLGIKVNINAPAKCGVTGLSNITFAYTAFQTSPSFQFTQFNANCTNTLAYTLSLVANGASSGVVAGLRYQLGLSDAVGSAGNIGPTSITRTGDATGTRIHTINGVMDAGQAGTSGAPVPQPHTLTISY
jgi:spore coat protein U-like protein